MQLLVYILVYPLILLISLLPDRLFYALSDAVCFFVYRVFGYRKKVVRNNLILSFPNKDISEIVNIEKQFYHHFCDIFLEMLKTITLSHKQMQKRMTFPNIEVLEPFVRERQSFVLMCGHYNSYEWLLSLASYMNCDSYAVYTPISNKYFDRLIKKTRAKFNAYLVSRYEFHSVIEKYKNKRQMCIFGLASDQSPSNSPKQYRRTFMGVNVPVFTGAERIAKQFNIPVVFCDIQKKARGYYETCFHIITQDPSQTKLYQITDEFTELLQNQIYKNPQYYLWSHNRFKHKKY